MEPCHQDDPRVVAARLAKQRMGGFLRGLPGVHGVSVGLRERQGRATDQVCIRVFVLHKVPLDQLGENDRVPPTVDGVPTDVVERPLQELQVERLARTNPLTGGISIGNATLGGSGTLGVSVFDARTGRDLVLSNWHVLCGSPSCRPGEPVTQPGTFDAPATGNRVGKLLRYALTSRVDAAVATVDGQRFLDSKIAELGEPTGIAPAILGARVRKSGRTTGVTIGRIHDIDLDVQVDFRPLGLGILTFEDQISIEPEVSGTVITARGDSGSVWLDDSNAMIGLLFSGASDGSSATAHPIQNVLEALDLTWNRGVRTQDLLEIVDNVLD